MTSGLAAFAPLFVGPGVFLLGTLLGFVYVLVIARVVIGLAWKLVVVAAIILDVFGFSARSVSAHPASDN